MHDPFSDAPATQFEASIAAVDSPDDAPATVSLLATPPSPLPLLIGRAALLIVILLGAFLFSIKVAFPQFLAGHTPSSVVYTLPANAPVIFLPLSELLLEATQAHSITTSSTRITHACRHQGATPTKSMD